MLLLLLFSFSGSFPVACVLFVERECCQTQTTVDKWKGTGDSCTLLLCILLIRRNLKANPAWSEKENYVRHIFQKSR